MKNKIGVLLVNLGTPSQPTPKAIRQYLAEFLHDKRVIELPRWLWCLILHGVILRVRPKKVAKLYQSIWTKSGSPLLVTSEKLATKLQAAIGEHAEIRLAMRYGKPNLKKIINSFADKQKLIVLPLYPQYAAATTASAFDATTLALKKWRYIPALHFVNSYADHPLYIDALAHSITQHWQQQGKPQKLIFSYHGLPQDCIDKGDPYFEQCQLTTQKVVEQLGLSADQWLMTFQSRVGLAKWLQPYTDETLKSLPKQGVKHIDIICPGFAVDCLETLEEIAAQNKALFMGAGGDIFHYIPALNDSDAQVELLAHIIQPMVSAPTACHPE